MGSRALAVLVVVALCPRAGADPALSWRAPEMCPDAADARARIERRLGQPIDRFVVGVAVDIAPDPDGYVAHVGGRTLTSATCDDLTDAVALVVARLAVASPVRDADAPVQTVQAQAASAAPAHVWSGGARLSFLSGVGNVPEVGFGGELAATVRRDRWFGEVAGASWASSSRSLTAGAPAHVAVHLDTLTFRAGYAAAIPIRGWVVVDAGAIGGEGVALPSTQDGSAPWIAAGAGFAVAWPIVHGVRLVGTVEALVTIERSVRFELSDGYVVYQPAWMSARTSFGVELDWP